MNKPKVLVLLATHNGEKYLDEQLQSIFNQIGVDVSILASDDNSTDKTIDILEKYSQNNNVCIIKLIIA